MWTVKRNSCKKFAWKRILSVWEAAFWKSCFQKNCSAPNDPQNDIERFKPKVPHMCWNTLCESQISLHFALRLFLPQGVEIELIFALRAAVSEIQADFQNCHILAWNLAIGQSSRIAHILASFYPKGSKLSPFFCSTGASIQADFKFEIQADFQNLRHETWPLAKVPEVAHIPSFYPKGSKLSNIWRSSGRERGSVEVLI